MASGAGEAYIGKNFHFRHSGRVVTVQSVLGEGGFSLVFLVTTSSNQRFALKRMCVNNQHDLEICRREIAIVKSTYGGHKNAVKYVDCVETVLKKGIFEILLLMEYCSGGTLVELMNKHIDSGFREELCLRIFCDLCEAMAKLHLRRVPIIHRDIKVENVLLSENGDYQLCDFGSATLKEVKPLVEGVGKVQEELDKYTTLAYRSPEMVDVYSGLAIGPKADIWAMGCFLYKLCFFTNPFGESILGIQSGSFSFPESSRYSMGMHSLIAYMLEPNPSKRPNICQVAHIAFKMRGLKSPIPNVFKLTLPEKLPPVSREVRPRRQQDKRAKEAVSTTPTSFAPRERPRAGGSGGSQPSTQKVKSIPTQQPLARSLVAENITMPSSSVRMNPHVNAAQSAQQHNYRPQPVVQNVVPIHTRPGVKHPGHHTSSSASGIVQQQRQADAVDHHPINKAFPAASHRSTETDRFGLAPFGGAVPARRPPHSVSDSAISSHYYLRETDVFGAQPFLDSVQEVEHATDSFGSAPFKSISSTSSQQSDDVDGSSVTDAFGATPFTPTVDGTRSHRFSASSGSSAASGRDGIRLAIRSVSESPVRSLSGSPLISPAVEESGFYLPLSNAPDRPRTAPQSPVHGNAPFWSDSTAAPASGLPKAASLMAISDPQEQPLFRSTSSQDSREASLGLEETAGTPLTPSVVFTDDKGFSIDEFGAVPFNAVLPEPSLDPFGFEPFNPSGGSASLTRQRAGSRSKHAGRRSGSLEDLATVIGNPSASGLPGPNRGMSALTGYLASAPGELKKAKSQDFLAGTPV